MGMDDIGTLTHKMELQIIILCLLERTGRRDFTGKRRGSRKNILRELGEWKG